MLVRVVNVSVSVRDMNAKREENDRTSRGPVCFVCVQGDATWACSFARCVDSFVCLSCPHMCDDVFIYV